MRSYRVTVVRKAWPFLTSFTLQAFSERDASYQATRDGDVVAVVYVRRQ